jgi:hypothetical protein
VTCFSDQIHQEPENNSVLVTLIILMTHVKQQLALYVLISGVFPASVSHHLTVDFSSFFKVFLCREKSTVRHQLPTTILTCPRTISLSRRSLSFVSRIASAAPNLNLQHFE